MAALVGHLTIEFNSNKFNSLGLLFMGYPGLSTGCLIYCVLLYRKILLVLLFVLFVDSAEKKNR